MFRLAVKSLKNSVKRIFLYKKSKNFKEQNHFVGISRGLSSLNNSLQSMYMREKQK